MGLANTSGAFFTLGVGVGDEDDEDEDEDDDEEEEDDEDEVELLRPSTTSITLGTSMMVTPLALLIFFLSRRPPSDEHPDLESIDSFLVSSFFSISLSSSEEDDDVDESLASPAGLTGILIIVERSGIRFRMSSCRMKYSDDVVLDESSELEDKETGVIALILESSRSSGSHGLMLPSSSMTSTGP